MEEFYFVFPCLEETVIDVTFCGVLVLSNTDQIWKFVLEFVKNWITLSITPQNYNTHNINSRSKGFFEIAD